MPDRDGDAEVLGRVRDICAAFTGADEGELQDRPWPSSSRAFAGFLALLLSRARGRAVPAPHNRARQRA